VLSEEIVGYANCTPPQLLAHLLKYYDMIAPTELTQKYERLNMPYDRNQPIKKLFQQIQDARTFVMASGQPYGDVMIVNVVFTLVVKLLPLPHPPRARPHGRTDKSKRPESHPTKECDRTRVRCI
jgi:hypothetical protein